MQSAPPAPLRGRGSSLLCLPDGPQAAVSSAEVQLAPRCMVSTLGRQTLSLHRVPQAQGAVSGSRHLGLTQPNPPALNVLLSDTHGSGPGGQCPRSRLCVLGTKQHPKALPISGCPGRSQDAGRMSAEEHTGGKKRQSCHPTLLSMQSNHVLQNKIPFQQRPAPVCLRVPPKAHRLTRDPA